MNDEELRHYFLTHRDNTEAFHAYMDRLRAQPRSPMIQADELTNLSFDVLARVNEKKRGISRIQPEWTIVQPERSRRIAG